MISVCEACVSGHGYGAVSSLFSFGEESLVNGPMMSKKNNCGDRGSIEEEIKYDLLSWREHIPKEAVDGKKGTPTEWSLKRVMAMKSTFGQVYPRSVQVAEAALAVPVSNAWPERGAIQMKLIKTRIKSQIKND